MKKVKKAAKGKIVKRAKPKMVKEAAEPRKIKIKKMPKKTLKKYKALLLKEREKIGGGISHITNEALKTSQRDASGDLSGYSFHMADVASDNYEVEFSLGRASDEQNIMYTIDEALKRVEDGTYGNCIQCGKPIPKKRLEALPHTELCIACQSKNEST
ncbi:MAG: TraR/DksA C4-type zinc finger protein [Candidatus Omnitrophota bacterium]|nr:TraR/DksA C4-type zinc finger protein [Candidatus Omnitrophota bacterium]